MTNAAFSMPFQAFNSDSFSKFFTMPDGMSTVARETAAASTQSTRASMKGMQDVGAALMRQIKDQSALSVETGKKLAEAGSVEAAMAVHGAYIKSAIEANMKGFTELSTLYTDTIREAFAPLAKQAKKAAKAS